MWTLWTGKTLWRRERRTTTIPTMIIEKTIYWIIKIYYTCWIQWHPVKMILQPKPFSRWESEREWWWWILEPHIAQLPITCTHLHTQHFYSWSFSFMIAIHYSCIFNNIENSIHSFIHSFAYCWTLVLERRKNCCFRSPFIQIMMVKSISNEITFGIPSVCWLFLFFHLIACIRMKIIAWHKMFEKWSKGRWEETWKKGNAHEPKTKILFIKTKCWRWLSA